MIQTLQFPLQTKSENVYRSMANPFVRHSVTKKQRAFVRTVLDSQLVRRPIWLADCQTRNTFEVLLVRLSAGTLDDDNLRGSLKSVRDEIAAWLGVDDGERCIRFEYGQEPCRRGTAAVRIEIVDQENEHVERRKVVGPSVAIPLPLPRGGARRARGRGPISRMGADDPPRCRGCGEAVPFRDGGGRGNRAARSEASGDPDQRRLAFMRSLALLPWDQDGGEPVVTELEALDGELDPPPRILVQAPAGVHAFRVQGRAVEVRLEGGRLALERHRWRDPELGRCWIYLAPGKPDRKDDDR